MVIIRQRTYRRGNTAHGHRIHCCLWGRRNLLLLGRRWCFGHKFTQTRKSRMKRQKFQTIMWVMTKIIAQSTWVIRAQGFVTLFGRVGKCDLYDQTRIVSFMASSSGWSQSLNSGSSGHLLVAWSGRSQRAQGGTTLVGTVVGLAITGPGTLVPLALLTLPPAVLLFFGLG